MKKALTRHPPRVGLGEGATSFHWEPQGEEQDGTALLGAMTIGGVAFHVNAIKVTTKSAEGDRSTQTGWPDPDGCQQPVRGDACLYRDMLDVYDEAMQTVKIPGHPGDWVLVIHPHGD